MTEDELPAIGETVNIEYRVQVHRVRKTVSWAYAGKDDENGKAVYTKKALDEDRSILDIRVDKVDLREIVEAAFGLA